MKKLNKKITIPKGTLDTRLVDFDKVLQIREYDTYKDVLLSLGSVFFGIIITDVVSSKTTNIITGIITLLIFCVFIYFKNKSDVLFNKLNTEKVDEIKITKQ